VECSLYTVYPNRYRSSWPVNDIGSGVPETMGDNVVDFNSKRDAARHRRKEQRLDTMQKRFESALPTEEKDPKKKLLNIFKKKKPKK